MCMMQEAPDSASAHEAPTEDAVDNDDDLVKDAKKVYKPFASVHHYADCAIASVTWHELPGADKKCTSHLFLLLDSVFKL